MVDAIGQDAPRCHRGIADLVQVLGFDITGHVIENAHNIRTDILVRGEKGQVGVDFRRDRMIIAGAAMGIGFQPGFFLTHNQGKFGMGFEVNKPVHHLNPGAFQITGKADIQFFIKPGLDFHHGGDRLAAFGG